MRLDVDGIQVIIKVEPRTFLSNERLLFRWTATAAFLLLSAIIFLLSYETSHRAVGTALCVVASYMLMYSLHQYLCRKNALVEGNPRGPFKDMWMPFFLGGTLLVLNVMTFVAALQGETDNMKPTWTSLRKAH